MRNAERRNVNVLDRKCLRSVVGVSRKDRVRDEEMRTWKEWMSAVWPEGC